MSGIAARFGPFRLSRAEYSLRRLNMDNEWTEIPLRPKAFDLLCYMVARPGRVIPPEEFFELVWPNVHVQPEVLKGHMLNVRTALQDDPTRPAYIETVRGRGYRFIGKVETTSSIAAPGTFRQDAELLSAGAPAGICELEALLHRTLAAEGESGLAYAGPMGGSRLTVAELLSLAIGAREMTVLPLLADGNEFSTCRASPEFLAQLSQAWDSSDPSEMLSMIGSALPALLPWVVVAALVYGLRRPPVRAAMSRVLRDLCDALLVLAQSAE
jgi:DNA-binding winged helix-turn-helix (wHTH) protein